MIRSLLLTKHTQHFKLMKLFLPSHYSNQKYSGSRVQIVVGFFGLDSKTGRSLTNEQLINPQYLHCDGMSKLPIASVYVVNIFLILDSTRSNKEYIYTWIFGEGGFVGEGVPRKYLKGVSIQRPVVL